MKQAEYIIKYSCGCRMIFRNWNYIDSKMDAIPQKCYTCNKHQTELENNLR